MASANKSVAIYFILTLCILASIVCGAGWFQAREESRQVREMNRQLVAQLSQGHNAAVVNENAAAAIGDSAEQSTGDGEKSPQGEDGPLILPPGLGQEYPELLLPMTPDRAAGFERRHLQGPLAPNGRFEEW